MNKSAIAIVFAFAGLGYSSLSEATVIDFNLPSAEYGPTYTQDGFTLSFTRVSKDGSSVDPKRVFLDWIKLGDDPKGSHSAAANGYNSTITTNYDHMTNIFSRSDNSSFDFNGISLADGYNSTGGGIVDLLFRYSNGEVEQISFTLQSIKGLQRFSYFAPDLLSVSLTGRTTYQTLFQFDFLDVGSPTSSVPEPSTWALMLIGFGIVGYAARRTRRPSMRMQVV